jgi:hypothetical protein
LQFHALRDEILALKERVIRMQTVAISGIPLIVAAGYRLELYIIIIAAPIITIIAVLMLLFEQNSIMRAGQYIREYIEPNLKSNIIGWEVFLESFAGINRRAEKYFLSSVVIALVLYYLAGSIFACYEIIKHVNLGQYRYCISLVLFIFYGLLFPFCIRFVVKNFKTNTK